MAQVVLKKGSDEAKPFEDLQRANETQSRKPAPKKDPNADRKTPAEDEPAGLEAASTKKQES